tara:strand:+ start:93 stop:692 length:600 start_codon:yes stop_codon:yes gene_type:complete
MKGLKTVRIGAFTFFNFLILFLGINEFTVFPFNNSVRFLTSKLTTPSDVMNSRIGHPRDALCFGPFYEKSEAYHQANTLRDLGVFPKKEVLEVNNFGQLFVVIGNNLSSDESATISKELSLLDISHFKVSSGEGTVIHIEVAKEKQVRDSQYDELAFLGRRLEYLEVERQSTLYFLTVDKGDRGKLSHIKEKRCIGIAP